MRTRSFILLVLLVTLSGCIVTYRDFPQEQMEAPLIQKKNFPLYFRGSSPSTQEMLWRGLLYTFWLGANPLNSTKQCGDQEFLSELTVGKFFPEVINVPAPPTKGVYYAVELTEKHVSEALKYYSHLSDPVALFSYGEFRLLPLLPVYSGEAGLIIRYDLYVNQELRKAYRYEISKKGVSWIGLVPLAWVNLFTYNQKDACRATFYQFLTDADRDGYLRGD